MKYKKEIDVSSEYDVIVIGGTIAGISATVSIAKSGYKTLLIESSQTLGGEYTIGQKKIYYNDVFDSKNKTSDLLKEIYEKVVINCPYYNNTIKNFALNIEDLKRTLDQIVVSSSADVLFRTNVVDVIMNKQEIDYIVVSNKFGLKAYKAKMYIDCTNDANLVFLAGGLFNKIEENNPKLCFSITNVDTEEYLKRKIDNSAILGEGFVNLELEIANSVDNRNNNKFLEAKTIILARKLARLKINDLKTNEPKIFANSFLVNSANNLICNRKRMVVGDYTYTKNDYDNNVLFSNSVFDYVDDNNKIISLNSKILFPQNINNIIVAGKAISVEEEIAKKILNINNEIKIGEFTGKIIKSMV